MSERTQRDLLEAEMAPGGESVAGVGVGSGAAVGSRWLKRRLAGSPFYLVSAALLLFGLSRESADPVLLRTELAQWTFRFSVLELYELLLVGTAIVLARRAVWYDSALLLVLENVFVLGPFMLVSQAAFMQPERVWVFCGLAVVLVGMRVGAARRFGVGFAPSPRLVAAGMGVLATNAALPVIYRCLHEFKVGTRPTSGAAFEMNEQSWLWLLPVLCALTSLLPHPREDGKLPVQRRWFPVALLFVWLTGTGVHLYSLGYVYDFALRRELVAPALCVLAWMLHLRLKDFISKPTFGLRAAVLSLPSAATLLAAGVEHSLVGFTLAVLNTAGYACVALVERDNRIARHLLLAALALAVAALPHEWAGPGPTGLGPRLHWIALALTAYLVLRASVSRNPKLAVAGAAAAMLLTDAGARPAEDALHWAAQAGLIYYLLHSLRWRDHEHEGASLMRRLTALAWVTHTFLWVRAAAPVWQPPAAATLVVAVCALHWWIRRKRVPVAIPVAAIVIALLPLGNTVFIALQATPVGLVAVGASFVLFGLGTLAVVTKFRWCPGKVDPRL